MAARGQLYPITRERINLVRRRHQQIAHTLIGDDRAEEATRVSLVEEAVEIGCKKGVMTQARMRELCDQYLKRFGHP